MTRRRAALALPALLAVLLHLPTLGHEFVFDDRGVILENPLMRDLADLPRLLASPWWNAAAGNVGLWRPLTSASFAVDRALAGGFQPAWFHAVNVAFHGLATWLVTLLALALGGGMVAALMAGGLFAVHPVHVEAVAGVVGRAELLAACGVLGALLLHRRALSAAGRGGAVAAAVAPLCGFAAMMAKESGFVAPVLVWIFERTVIPGRGPSARRRLVWGGHIAALVAALGLRFAAVGGLGPGGAIPMIDNPAASAGAIAGRLTALACVTRYATLLLWPRHLSADYSYDQIPVVMPPGDARSVLGALLVAGVVLGGVLLWRRTAPYGFCLLFVAVALAPASNLLVFAGTLLAERLLYLPSAGLCLLAGLLAAGIARAGPRRLAIGAVGALAIAGALRTWTRLPDWRDDFALYRSAALVSPRSARIRYNLGNAWLRLRRYVEAEGEYRLALGIYPDFADARANLGMALLQQGRAAEALEVLQEAAARLPRNAEVAVNVGSAERALGRADRAEAEFRRALSIDPGAATAWNNLGSLLLQRGDVPAAVTALERATTADPAAAIYHVNLGDALRATGRDPGALEQFDQAFRLEPRLPEARRAAGEAALMRGDRQAAARHLEAALAGDPPSARAANFLGYLAAQAGDAQAAAGFYERALALDSTLDDAHRSLGLILSRLPGQERRAADHLKAALELDPGQAGAADLRSLIDRLERVGR